MKRISAWARPVPIVIACAVCAALLLCLDQGGRSVVVQRAFSPSTSSFAPSGGSPPSPLIAIPSPLATPAGAITPRSGIEIALTFVPPETTAALSQGILITHSAASRSGLVVNGNYVVWRSYEDGQTNVVAYNLQTRRERRLSRLAGGKRSVRVSDRYVAWEDTLDQPNQDRSVVRGYDLATDHELALGPSQQIQRDPDVSRDIMVWSEPFHSEEPLASGIYAYDINTQRTFAIATGTDAFGYPRIGGDWVIYFSWKRDPQTAQYSLQPALRAHRISTGEDFELGDALARNDASCCDNHMISGSSVVWEGRDARLHYYDLATREGHILDERRFGSFDLHGNILSLGSMLMNLETGSTVQLFQPFRPDRPAHIDSIATDGRTLAWIPDMSKGEVYVARLLSAP